MTAWRCAIRLDPLGARRPGALVGVCAVFTARGISLDALTASADATGAGLITLGFAASPQLAGHLARRLGRLPLVRGVDLTEG